MHGTSYKLCRDKPELSTPKSPHPLTPPVALSLHGMRASSTLPCCSRVVTCPVPSFPSSVYSRVPKKSSQELYGLICYAELRKKVGGCKQTRKRTNTCCCCCCFLQFVGVLSLHFASQGINRCMIAVLRERGGSRGTKPSTPPLLCVFVFGSDGRQERGEAQRTHPAGVSRKFMLRVDQMQWYAMLNAVL